MQAMHGNANTATAATAATEGFGRSCGRACRVQALKSPAPESHKKIHRDYTHPHTHTHTRSAARSARLPSPAVASQCSEARAGRCWPRRMRAVQMLRGMIQACHGLRQAQPGQDGQGCSFGIKFVSPEAEAAKQLVRGPARFRCVRTCRRTSPANRVCSTTPADKSYKV